MVGCAAKLQLILSQEGSHVRMYTDTCTHVQDNHNWHQEGTGAPGPAGGTSLPDTRWKLMTWFMRAVDRTISSKTGTLAPTMPVFPPCGVTARFLSWQCLGQVQKGHQASVPILTPLSPNLTPFLDLPIGQPGHLLPTASGGAPHSHTEGF